MPDDIFRQAITLFIFDYLDPSGKGLDARGFATDMFIAAAMEFLISKGVFKTVDELRRRAVKSRGVIIPHRYFEGVKLNVQ